jgi:hypothetical protein
LIEAETKNSSKDSIRILQFQLLAKVTILSEMNRCIKRAKAFSIIKRKSLHKAASEQKCSTVFQSKKHRKVDSKAFQQFLPLPRIKINTRKVLAV